MNSVVQCEDDHYQMALSLKDWSLKMPGKRVQAELRALLPKSRFLRDSWFLEDYVSSLKNVIENGFAEKVPGCELRWSDGKVYYNTSPQHLSSQEGGEINGRLWLFCSVPWSFLKWWATIVTHVYCFHLCISQPPILKVFKSDWKFLVEFPKNIILSS